MERNERVWQQEGVLDLNADISVRFLRVPYAVPNKIELGATDQGEQCISFDWEANSGFQVAHQDSSSLERFLRLHDASAETIRDFAKTCGPLGVCQHMRAHPELGWNAGLAHCEQCQSGLSLIGRVPKGFETIASHLSGQWGYQNSRKPPPGLSSRQIASSVIWTNESPEMGVELVAERLLLREPVSAWVFYAGLIRDILVMVATLRQAGLPDLENVVFRQSNRFGGMFPRYSVPIPQAWRRRGGREAADWQDVARLANQFVSGRPFEIGFGWDENFFCLSPRYMQLGLWGTLATQLLSALDVTTDIRICEICANPLLRSGRTQGKPRKYCGSELCDREAGTRRKRTARSRQAAAASSAPLKAISAAVALQFGADAPGK